MALAVLLAAALAGAIGQRWLALCIWGRPEFARGFQGDASVHFAIIRHYACGNGGRYVGNFLISPEPMSYPTLFHHFSQIFPLATLRRRPWLPNFVLHLLGTVFLVVVVRAISGSLAVTAVAVCVYLLSPMQWLFYGPAISYLGLSERFLARLTCSAAYMSLAAGSALDAAWLLMLGTVLAALAMLASVFARQALFFCVPLLTVVLLDPRPVLQLAIAVGLALLVGRRHFWDGLKHTALQWKLYRSLTKRNEQVLGGLTGYFRWRTGFRSKWRMVAYNLVEKDPTRTFFWYPELLLLAALLALGSAGGVPPMALAVLPPLAIYLLTLSERFNHLGEAYRYIEYNLSFLLPLLVGLAFAGGPLQTTILAAYAALVATMIALRYGVRLRRLRREGMPDDEISRFIEQSGVAGPAVVFPVSMRFGADLVARRGDWKSFWWQPGIISELIYTDYVEEYPFLKRDWRKLSERHGVTHIFCDKRLDALKGWQYDFSGAEKIAENEHFVAYRVQPAG